LNGLYGWGIRKVGYMPLFREAVFQQALLRAAIANLNTNRNPNSLTITPYC